MFFSFAFAVKLFFLLGDIYDLLLMVFYETVVSKWVCIVRFEGFGLVDLFCSPGICSPVGRKADAYSPAGDCWGWSLDILRMTYK